MLLRRTIFSDENRFCLDVPDGRAKYWMDKRMGTGIFSKRKFGSGGVMVWGTIYWRGKVNIPFID